MINRNTPQKVKTDTGTVFRLLRNSVHQMADVYASWEGNLFNSIILMLAFDKNAFTSGKMGACVPL